MPCCATVWTGRPSPAEKRGYSLVRLKNATIPSSRPAFQRRPCADWLKHGRQATARSAARSVLEPGEHGCIIEAGYDRTRTKRIRQLLLARPRKDTSKTRTAGQIAHTIRTLAKYHLSLPEQDLVILNNITRRLNVSTPGMTDKNRERLAQFRDESVLQRFLSYPSAELGRLFRTGVQTRSSALEISLLIAWEVNMFAPMRIGNLAALQLDLHIRLPRQSGGEAVILIPSTHVKNRQPLYYHLPPRTTECARPLYRADQAAFKSRGIRLFVSCPGQIQASRYIVKAAHTFSA